MIDVIKCDINPKKMININSSPNVMSYHNGNLGIYRDLTNPFSNKANREN